MGREKWECDKWGQEWGALQTHRQTVMDTDRRVGVGETEELRR